jgi:hypothetical protein
MGADGGREGMVKLAAVAEVAKMLVGVVDDHGPQSEGPQYIDSSQIWRL